MRTSHTNKPASLFRVRQVINTLGPTVNHILACVPFSECVRVAHTFALVQVLTRMAEEQWEWVRFRWQRGAGCGGEG